MLDNTALRTLNLANNAIDCIGAVTLAVGLRENATLHEVILDGNPIGEQGKSVALVGLLVDLILSHPKI